MLELQDLRDFSIHAWYETFKEVTLKTYLVRIPDQVLAKCRTEEGNFDFVEDGTAEFIDALTDALNSLQRLAFVKSNWHSARDAKMFSLGHLLKVTSIEDIQMYFSASSLLLHDLGSEHTSIPMHVALKPWKSIHPASEFRCIVINKILRGITPRDFPTYYAHFDDDGPKIIQTLRCFFSEHVVAKFPRAHYTFDVVISFIDDPYILDFGPLNNKTRLYAFSWSEISGLFKEEAPANLPPVFRYLATDIGILGGSTHEFL